MPLVGEGVEVEPGGALEGGAGRACGLEALDDLGHLLPPVLLGHEVPHALPAAVGEVAAEPLDLGEAPREDGLAEVHVALGVPALRGVLGEPLVEPQRDGHGAALTQRGAHGAAVEEVVQDGVDQLVVHHAAEVAPVARERHGDPVLEQLRHPADALGVDRELDGVRDGEVVVALVDEQRDPVRDLGAEERAHLRVRLLGGVGGDLREVLPAGLVVVDVEVAALEEVPVVLLVLHPVFPEAEVLRAHARREHGGTEHDEEETETHGRATTQGAPNVRSPPA